MELAPRIFGAPGRYVQGAGAIHTLGSHISVLGSSVLVVGGKSGLEVTRAGRDDSFRQYGLKQTEVLFQGEASAQEIARLSSLGKEMACDAILASGGGKAIDAVKAAAEDMGVPAVIVPTIASNDAPCSALSVLYHEDGSFHRLRRLKNSPALVLVDTEIIAKAPVRQLVSGMGDALATWFEAEACAKSGVFNSFGGLVSQAGLGLAQLCCTTLLAYGREARAACEQKIVTPALDKIVEANTLLSGLGFESAGVAVAHALSEAFSVIHEMHAFTHGETVAFGLLAQLHLEKRSLTEINDIYSFCMDVGLPVTLGELGYVSSDHSALRQAADTAAEPRKPSHNMPFPVTGSLLFDAIMAADKLGRELKAARS